MTNEKLSGILNRNIITFSVAKKRNIYDDDDDDDGEQQHICGLSCIESFKALSISIDQKRQKERP